MAKFTHDDVQICEEKQIIAIDKEQCMMKRILIYRDVEETEYAVFRKTDYKEIYKDIHEERHGNWPNYANKLWFQGLISEISTSENVVEYMRDGLSFDEINNTYDIVILSCANIFSTEYGSLMEKTAEEFSHIKIPIFVISCGVQAKSYDELNQLIDTIK